MIFSLDKATAAKLDRTADRLGLAKSRVVREALHEYVERVGRLGDGERRRLLAVFDEMVLRIPERPVKEVERELAEIRRSRRAGGRRGGSPARPIR